MNFNGEVVNNSNLISL